MSFDGDSQLAFQYVKDLGAGSFGAAKLMVDPRDGEHVAVKFLERGPKVDKHVEREILIHSELVHPCCIGFKSVYLTPHHLGIVLEYAPGGDLFSWVKRERRLCESEARYFFQQIIAGVNYCHKSGVVHRDLKLENILIDGSSAPVLKLADFGFSKHELWHTPPNTVVGTPAYISPEVLLGNLRNAKEYDGRAADVWSCGVILYVMLVGAYPFEDPRDIRNIMLTQRNMVSGTFCIPPGLQLSRECVDLISRMLVPDVNRRISIAHIIAHPWYQMNLPYELLDGCMHLPRYRRCTQPRAEIQAVIRAAQVLE